MLKRAHVRMSCHLSAYNTRWWKASTLFASTSTCGDQRAPAWASVPHSAKHPGHIFVVHEHIWIWTWLGLCQAQCARWRKGANKHLVDSNEAAQTELLVMWGKRHLDFVLTVVPEPLVSCTMWLYFYPQEMGSKRTSMAHTVRQEQSLKSVHVAFNGLKSSLTLSRAFKAAAV